MTSGTKPNPVIFIHGLWIHSTAWQPWLELFESRGSETSAPGWPGDAPTVAETREHADAVHAEWTIPGPGRPLFEDAGANFSRHSPAKVDTHNVERGPLLLASGTEDHTVPLKVTKEVFGMYSKGLADTDFHVFEGRGHSLTIDGGWKDVADVALDWFAAKQF